jgi:hypothetical protein
VALARQANGQAGGRNPVILGTLAAALAETGQFPEAIQTAQQATQLANAASNAAVARSIESQMTFYQAGKPFHSSAR